MTNIFLVFSKQHLEYSETIVKCYCSTDHNILITESNFKENGILWDETIYLSRIIYNQQSYKVTRALHLLKKIKVYRNVVKKVRSYQQERDLTVYFSSLEDILSNYLLLNFSNNIKGVIIEDGILNYYDHNIKSIPRTNLLFKKILSKVGGLSFSYYYGHTSGIDYDKVLCQYVRLPNFAIRPDKSRILPIEKKTIRNFADGILIIGQEPYANILGELLYKKKLQYLFSCIRESAYFYECKNIYYKPHRHGPRLNIDFLRTEFKDKHFKYIDSDESMEKLYFEDIRCKSIYTFDSSALLNIYLDSDDRSKKEINFTVMPISTKTKRLFDKFDFKIITDDI